MPNTFSHVIKATACVCKKGFFFYPTMYENGIFLHADTLCCLYAKIKLAKKNQKKKHKPYLPFLVIKKDITAPKMPSLVPRRSTHPTARTTGSSHCEAACVGSGCSGPPYRPHPSIGSGGSSSEGPPPPHNPPSSS